MIRKTGASTVVLLAVVVGFGAAGLAVVSQLAGRISDQTVTQEAEQLTLRRSAPDRCSGASVVARVSPGAAATIETRQGVTASDEVVFKPLPQPLFESVIRADLDGDGTITGAVTRAVIVPAAWRTVTANSISGAVLLYDTTGYDPAVDLTPPADYGDSVGYVAAHRGKACWTADVCPQDWSALIQEDCKPSETG